MTGPSVGIHSPLPYPTPLSGPSWGAPPGAPAHSRIGSTAGAARRYGATGSWSALSSIRSFCGTVQPSAVHREGGHAVSQRVNQRVERGGSCEPCTRTSGSPSPSTHTARSSGSASASTPTRPSGSWPGPGSWSRWPGRRDAPRAAGRLRLPPGNVLLGGARRRSVLAAADALQATTQDRPHRPGLAPEAASAALAEQARLGRLDPECVRAEIEAAGQP
jgi:hypothetical protein